MRQFILLPILLFVSTFSFAQNFREMGGFNRDGVPNYLDPAKETISPTLLADLNILLPDGQNLAQGNPGLYNGNTMTAVKVQQAGDVYLSFVSEGADFKSAVGFYTFTGSLPAQPFYINTFKVVFPNVSGVNSGGGLQQGHRVKLGNFAAGTQIGFFLISNGFQYGMVMSGGRDVFYTEPRFNPEGNASLKKHAVLMFDETTSRYVLMFEDMNRNSGSDNDFNDAVFVVSSSNPATLSTEGATVVQREKEVKLGIPKPERQINICHYPANGAPAENILIDESAWPGHQAHGDVQGSCPTVPEPEPVPVPVPIPDETPKNTGCEVGGDWYLAGTNQLNQIDLTASGIRAKAGRNAQWFTYSHAYSCTFRDSEGNEYSFNSTESGQWTSADRKVSYVLTRVPTTQPTIPTPTTPTHIPAELPTNPQPGNPTQNPTMPEVVLTITICHYPPGNTNNPQQISIPENDWPTHEAHGDVKGPCNTNPAPTTTTPPVEERKITICHYPPGNRNNPQELTISESAWAAHQAHGDVLGPCPTNPAPTTTTTPPVEEKKITICHYPPGNRNNPQQLTIPESAWAAHQAHGDVLGPCPTNPAPTTTTTPPVEEKKITICHYPPGKKGKPETITIAESAWKAHEAHGDTKGKCN